MAKADPDNAGSEKPPVTASAVFSVRMSPTDISALTEAARAQGISRNELIKRLARHAVGELTASDAMLDAWSNALRQLNGACNNLNQMTRTARRGQLVWRDAERADVRAVHEHADEVRRLLSAAVQTARKGRALPERLRRFADAPDADASGG